MPVFKVSLIKGSDGAIQDTSVVEFTSPIAEDPEGEKITMTFDLKGYSWMKATQNSDNSFTVKVDRSQITEFISQTYTIVIQIEDEQGNKPPVPSSLIIDVDFQDESKSTKSIEDSSVAKELADVPSNSTTEEAPGSSEEQPSTTSSSRKSNETKATIKTSEIVNKLDTII